ncbi:MAG: sensor histidine kinase [Anaerolineae bacterium]
MVSVDVLKAARLAPLAEIARAATGVVDRTAFLPLAVREASRLLNADACEAWLEESGSLSVAAMYHAPGVTVEPLDTAALERALDGQVVRSGGWLCAPIAADPAARGVLSVWREEPWTDADELLIELAATVVALGLKGFESGQFDDEARNEFLALVGHDLRSPLSNVRVGAQLARRNLDAGDIDSVREALVIIENQSGRLVDRLEALLDAVAAAGRWLIRLEPLDVPRLVESTVAPYRLAAEESGSGTRFEVHVEPGTPAARGDAEQIGQVLDHLIDNASKYAPGGLVAITVEPSGASVKVEVCDNGPGIRPEDVDRVFAPFGRGRSSASKDGYGLGLYLARNIVNAHGGRLWIARTSRSGTCMAFTLPASENEIA